MIYAYENVPYYRRTFDKVKFDPYKFRNVEEMQAIPFLDKNIAVSEGENLYSRENIACYESRTSGSTGTAFRILLDKDSIYKERAFVLHYLNKFGFDSGKTRTLAFWGHNKDQDYYYSPMKNEIVISPFRLFKESEFPSVWADINKFKPDVLSGYPSAIYVFAKLVRKYNKKLPVKFVEFYADNYTPEIKEYVEKTFGCRTVARYGHTERAVFAELYPEGYKFNELYGFTELIPVNDNSDVKKFRIVCTGFLSRKMPLIRYMTDDVVTYNQQGQIEISGHKMSETYLIGRGGVKIYKGTLAARIAPFEKIKLYQFVQYEVGKAYLDVMADCPLTDNDFKIINDYYERKCEGILKIEIRVVDKLIMSKRGKYSWIVNYITENNTAVQ
ncbi:MAG TPA: hypothetical protein IAA10_04200 [Candidatus Blautia intestinavium]|nr:hypothetical protein [Candidatus Blautia intestinavium]